MTVWNDIAELIDGRARKHAARAQPKRFKVRRPSPLVIDAVEGDLSLEEGDPDVEVHGTTATLNAGDLVFVAEDEHGDYIVLLPGGGG